MNIPCNCRTLKKTFWTSYQLLSGVPAPSRQLYSRSSSYTSNASPWLPTRAASWVNHVNSRAHAGYLCQHRPIVKSRVLNLGKSCDSFTGRKLLSNAKDIHKDVEQGQGGSEILWNHPAGRSEDALTKDPELRSLLCEIASDFGKSPTSDSESVNDDSSLPSFDKPNPAEDSANNHKTKKFVAMTTKEEEHLNSNSSDSAMFVKMDLSGDLTASRHSSDALFVFSIGELVDILRDENAKDICVIRVPLEKNYVDYFVIVTGRSTRHLSTMTQNINKLYKQQKSKSDPFLIVEGKLTDDWMCLDFGNIVVHFMLEETRILYDLEKLWTLGKEFDDHMQQWKQHEILMFNPETDLHAHVHAQPEEMTNKDQESRDDAK